MGTPTIRTILVSDLLVNPENPRFDPVKNQNEAIKLMLKREGRGIKKLAEDIITHGLSPLESFAVLSKNGKSLIMEGNRRVVALKLLDDPNKTDDQKLCEFFKKMKKESVIQIPDRVSCAVFQNEDEAHHWIKLKHTGRNKGAGTVPWNPVQQDRFLKKASRRVQLFEFAKDNGIDTSNVDSTSLDRLIFTPYVCEKIGISFTDGELELDKPKSDVKKNIKKVFGVMSKKEFKVGDIYTKEQREKWIDDVVGTKGHASETKGKTTATSTDSDSSSTADEEPGSASKDARKNKGKTSDRRNLIPEDCELGIPQGRINNIFLELRDDLIIDASRKSTPNAVGVLFRVFLEISLDYYIEKKKIDVTKKLQKKEKSPYKKYLTIDEKIRVVADYMEEKKVVPSKDQLKRIRQLADSKDTNMLNISRFHEFVHSPTIHPEDLKAKWDNLQSFFKILWANLNK